MKASNQKIIDQDEVIAVSVNKSLLSVDYASTSLQYPKGLTLIRIMQKTLRFLTTFKRAMAGSRSPRLALPNHPSPLVTYRA